MWPQKFEQRLNSWHEMRATAQSQAALPALNTINKWWHQSPWSPYYLHWDDLPSWPDPWQLLDDNIYCPVARSLGILYTITIINHPELQQSLLALTEPGDSVVLANNKKYVLGYSEKIKTMTEPIKIIKFLAQTSLKEKYHNA